jgi:methylmalonyl-CoA mutase cobalamin-binding subunit
MSIELARSEIFPEAALPETSALLAEGRELAGRVSVGPCPFFDAYGVTSEAEYKRRRTAEGEIMMHAHIGFRAKAKSCRAFAEIHGRLAEAGHRVDRFGICLDFSMGYPAERRSKMPRGTGMILDGPEDFIELTHSAPAAAHFGDWVLGTPASVENTAAALAAGATSIGNIGQYFTFDLPRWDDDVATTAETIKALALIAAQPGEVIVHSNLCDGYGALYRDLASVLGWVLVEQYVIEELIGARAAHSFGQTFSDPVTRLAFQRALAEVQETPGTMIYGNTTSYEGEWVANYGTLASYFLVDVFAQRTRPTGHAINPVPISEAERIPEIDEIVDAHLCANRLIERADGFMPLMDAGPAEGLSETIVAGARRFKENVLDGLSVAGIDVADPLEVLLGLRRIGAKRIEALFGAGEAEPGRGRRRPLVKATTVAEVEEGAEACVAALDASQREAIRGAGLRACVASTDVHEYGKVMVESVLDGLAVELVDAGLTTAPDKLVARARAGGADFIAVSTYNGVALSYLEALRAEMARQGLDVPVFIGGKLNQVPEASNTSLPVDVSADLARAGAVVCRGMDDMIGRLADMATAVQHG